MADWQNSFEALSSGSTFVAATSGGGPDIAVDSIITSGTITGTYSNAWAAGDGGLNSLRVVTADAAANNYVVQKTGIDTGQIAFRGFLNLTSFSLAQDILSVRAAAGQACTLSLTAAGALTVKNASGVVLKNLVAGAASGVITGVPTRVEFQVDPGVGTTDGTINCQVFVGNGTTAYDTYAASNISARTTNIIELRLGKLSNGASILLDCAFDAVAVDYGTMTPVGPLPTPQQYPTWKMQAVHTAAEW